MHLLLTNQQAANRLSMHPVTLATWRSQGKGPKYIKDGRYVRYRLKDIEEWEEQQTVH